MGICFLYLNAKSCQLDHRVLQNMTYNCGKFQISFFSNLISQNTFSLKVNYTWFGPRIVLLLIWSISPFMRAVRHYQNFCVMGTKTSCHIVCQCSVIYWQNTYCLLRGRGAIQQQDYQENVFTKDEFFIKVGQVLSSGCRNMGSGAFYNVLISY